MGGGTAAAAPALLLVSLFCEDDSAPAPTVDEEAGAGGAPFGRVGELLGAVGGCCDMIGMLRRRWE